MRAADDDEELKRAGICRPFFIIRQGLRPADDRGWRR